MRVASAVLCAGIFGALLFCFSGLSGDAEVPGISSDIFAMDGPDVDGGLQISEAHRNSVVRTSDLSRSTVHGAESQPPTNVLLVVIDTLRADRVSSYGYTKPTTPHIDAIAATGLRFANASSTSSWTLPAHASLFTGLPPILHGATQEHRWLGNEPATLASIMSEHGYATIGVSANPLVSGLNGLSRGFESFVRSKKKKPRRGLGSHPNLVALRELLETVPDGQGFFAFVNFIEPHGPYLPPEPWRSRFLSEGVDSNLVSKLNRKGAKHYYLNPEATSEAQFQILSELYDGEVAYVDALVGTMIKQLEKTGKLDDTLVIITSDHGENIGDHGHYRHVFNLYGTTVRIPLIIRPPGGLEKGEVIDSAVSLIDVFATVLAAVGASPPSAQNRGRDLLNRERFEEKPIFSEYYYPLQALHIFPEGATEKYRERLLPYLRRIRSVEASGMRLLWSSDGNHELFDTRRDPDESHNLAGEPAYGAAQRHLESLLEAYVADAGGSPPMPEEAVQTDGAKEPFGELDAETEQQLRELGYIR